MMRVIGAVLLMTGCSGFGFSIAYAQRKEVAMLRKLINALQEMEWELKYRMPDLAELCSIAASVAGGRCAEIFQELSEKLSKNEVTDISGSMNSMISQTELPRSIKRNMRRLASSLGRYDLEGQLEGLSLTRRQCKHDLNKMEDNSTQRMRNYQTLALCAGAALVILFI